MNLEGHIHIAVRTRSDNAAEVVVESSRAQLAQKLMAGRTADQAAELAGLLFSLCGRAQRIAATIACSAADFETTSEQTLSIHGEWAREHVWRLLLDWPEATGQIPYSEGLLALNRAGETAESLAETIEALLAEHLLGEAPERWLARDWPAFQDWLDVGQYAARLFDIPHDGPEPGTCAIALLPTLREIRDEGVQELAGHALADIDFCARPVWFGHLAETGALPRVIGHPLMEAWLVRRGRGADAHLLARLIELACMPTCLRADDDVVARRWTMADGTGVAGVETSRGVLFHIARLDDGKVRDYRIVSPTEWNFHPEGGLVEAMRRLPVDQRLEARAKRLVLAFDPCVDYAVEVGHA